jgi:thymidylate synthase ThyX
MIKAEVVADSISTEEKRLTTFKVRYPWFIHGEVMTHRVLSRNASSNRAIPLRKMLEEARSDELRAEPVYWGAEQKGMEPGGELTDETSPGKFAAYSPQACARIAWREAAFSAAACAEAMGSYGLHKSLCNRLLMPFTHANVVLTATEWGNFFRLRLDKAADPTMRALAEAMWVVMQESKPKLLRSGEWHLPFADNSQDWDEIETAEVDEAAIDKTLIKISVARCARVSYESFETGKRSTVEEDLKLYDRLLASRPVHASPAEHQATPDTKIYCADAFHDQYYSSMTMDDNGYAWENPQEHGNLVGWRQYRKMLPGENCAPLPESYRK